MKEKGGEFVGLPDLSQQMRGLSPFQSSEVTGLGPSRKSRRATATSGLGRVGARGGRSGSPRGPGGSGPVGREKKGDPLWKQPNS